MHTYRLECHALEPVCSCLLHGCLVQVINSAIHNQTQQLT